MPSSEEQAQAADAQARLEELRQSIGQYRRARAKTQQLVLSGKTMTPTEASRRAHALRDPAREREAAQTLVDLNRMLLGRDPTPAELEVGVPQLGVLPLLVLVPLIAGGAWTGSSLFNYLSERERRIQVELDPTSGSFLGGGLARWAIPAGLAAVGLVGGYLLLRGRGSVKGKKSKPKTATAKPAVFVENPPEDEDECDLESGEEEEQSEE